MRWEEERREGRRDEGEGMYGEYTHRQTEHKYTTLFLPDTM